MMNTEANKLFEPSVFTPKELSTFIDQRLLKLSSAIAHHELELNDRERSECLALLSQKLQRRSAEANFAPVLNAVEVLVGDMSEASVLNFFALQPADLKN